MRDFLSKYASFLVIPVIILITIVFLFYNHYRIKIYYKKQITSDSALIISKVNTLLNEYDQIISDVVNKSEGKSCKTQESYLLETVLSNYKIRSLTTVHNGSVFCSSYYKVNALTKKTVAEYTNYQLNVLPSRFSRPKVLVMSYSITRGHWAGIITSPATIFLKEIPLTQFSQNTYIIFNNQWLNIKNYNLLNDRKSNIKWRFFTSDKYPFSVAFNLSAIKMNNSFYLSYFLIALGGVIACIVFIFYILFTKPKHDLKKAILNGEIIPYYQLLVSAKDQEWVGAEVLSRWQHPKKGLVMPSEFIPLAENSGLIIPLTKMLMKKVAKELSSHVNCFPKRKLSIGFNIHQSHLKNHGLLEDCKAFLATFPPETIHLSLEVVESQFIESSAELDHLLQQFRKIGITIAIDDFGTGYSNFGYLQKYNIDHLKIDKLFISKICNLSLNTYLLDTIIILAKKLNMNTIAEGVETKEQFHHLLQQGINTIQGFLFSKPAPLLETIELLSKPIKKIAAPLILC